MTRRTCLHVIAVIAVGVASAAAVPTLATATGTAPPRGATSGTGPTQATGPTSSSSNVQIKKKDVASAGTYVVVVKIAPPAALQLVNVYAGSQAQRNVALSTDEDTSLAFTVTLRGRSFHVRIVRSGTPPLHFTVAAVRQPDPTTTPPPPPTVVPTGSTSPTGPTTGPYNTLVWSDEFDGPAGTPPNPAAWTPDSGGGCGPGTLSTNTRDLANAQMNGAGDLQLTAYGPTATPPYSTAQIDTAGKFSFTYGRIEARIDIPAGVGLCSAFWLVADDGRAVGWPNGGEMDVMEAIGNLPARVNAFLHGPITTGGSNYQQWHGPVTATTPLAGHYHTYGLIWKQGSLTWTLDGVPYSKATPEMLPSTARWVFDGHPFHIVLDLAVGGWPGNPAPTTVFPAGMLVDWVRVYQ